MLQYIKKCSLVISKQYLVVRAIAIMMAWQVRVQLVGEGHRTAWHLRVLDGVIPDFLFLFFIFLIRIILIIPGIYVECHTG